MDRFPYLSTRAITWLMLLVAVPGAALNAQTFLTTPVNLSATGSGSMPAIAVGPSGDIDVAWRDSGRILFKRLANGGQTFFATMTVATTNLSSQASQPQIAVNSAGVYVAWAGTNSGGGSDIFFSSLTNGSSSWLSPVNVSQGNGIAAGGSAPVPHMAVDPNGVDIVWGQTAAYFARTTDGGNSFATTMPALSTLPMASVSPRLAISAAGTVYVVWENAGSCPTITFARSTDNGAHFTNYPVDDTLTVNTVQQTGCTYDVQIALGASSTIHLLWANDHSNISSIRDLITTYQTDSGSSFAGFDAAHHLGFQNLSSTASYVPEMAIDGSGNIDVVWMGEVSNSDSRQLVYFSRSQNSSTQPAGQIFSNPQPLTSPPASSSLATGFPQISVEASGAIDVIWQQASATNPSSAFDIVLAHSTDGVNFTKTILDSVSTTQSGTAQIAADASGSVYASWQGSSGSGSDVLLNGDSAGLQASATFSLSAVTASVSPSSAVINVGGSATFNLSLHSTNSVPGTVSLACGGVPSGLSCSFNPSSLSLAANGTASSALSVSVSLKPSASVAQRGQPGPPAAVAWMWGIGLALFATILIAKPLMVKTSELSEQSPNRGALRYQCADWARAFALTLLLAAAAAGMQSCGGGTQSGGGGNGGGGGGGSITVPLTLQARSNSTSSNLQTITITVP
jgi:hypothetical protein